VAREVFDSVLSDYTRPPVTATAASVTPVGVVAPTTSTETCLHTTASCPAQIDIGNITADLLIHSARMTANAHLFCICLINSYITV